jgi:NAD dependent epimerase/dehydratase family enzyme
MLLGEFAEVLLTSQRALPRAALAAGFAFRFAELEAALRDVLRR